MRAGFPRGAGAATLLAAAALLAGCAVPRQPLELPAAPVAQHFPDPGTLVAGAPQPADLEWRQLFVDPQLQELIARALQHNRELRVAVLAIGQARAQLRLREAERLPNVQLALGGNRQPTAAGGTSTTWSAGVGITAYELDLFGRLGDLAEAAQAQLLATEEARKTVHIGLVAAVAGTWLALRADEAQLHLAQQTLATREESLRLTQLRVGQGVGSAIDLQQAQSLLAAAQAAQAQARRQRALDENTLTLLLGQPAPLPPRPGADTGAPWTPVDGLRLDVPAGLPSELLARRPDVRRAEQALRAAHANVDAARAAFFPRITLTTSLGSVSSELGRLLQGGSWGWTLAPQLLAPLFDAGRNEANLQAAQLAREAALAQYEGALQAAFREVADALATRTTLAGQLAAQQALAAAEQERMRLTELRWRNGVASALEWLDAQRSVFAARQALVPLQLQQAQNLVRLYQALGGGWSATADATP